MTEQVPEPDRGLGGRRSVRDGSETGNASVELLPGVVGGVGDDAPPGEVPSIGGAEVPID